MAIEFQTAGFGSALVPAPRHPSIGPARTVGELRYEGRHSGLEMALPVSCVRADDSVVVRVSDAATKTWWRNFRSEHPVSIRIDGTWQHGTGRTVMPGTIEHERIEARYSHHHPRAADTGEEPFVVIDVGVGLAPEPDLRRRWFTAATTGGFLGFGIPATTGALTADAGTPVLLSALLLAGLAAGAALGAFQASVLRRVWPALRTGDWMAATALGALAAWLLGSIPMLYGDRISKWSLWIQVPATAVGATILFFSLGAAQWLVLRRFTSRAVLWMWANAAARIGGLIVLMAVAAPLWRPGQSPSLVAAIGALGGLCMAAVVAAATAMFLPGVTAPQYRLDRR